MSIGYRALPETIKHPKFAETLSEDIFNSYTNKKKLQDALPLLENYLGTEVWYSEDALYKGYILRIKLKDEPDIFVKSICTFTPSFGMDSIDGSFAEDIEEYLISKKYNVSFSRLEIFNNKEEVAIMDYLKARGFEGLPKKRWWRFWDR